MCWDKPPHGGGFPIVTLKPLLRGFALKPQERRLASHSRSKSWDKSGNIGQRKGAIAVPNKEGLSRAIESDNVGFLSPDPTFCCSLRMNSASCAEDMARVGTLIDGDFVEHHRPRVRLANPWSPRSGSLSGCRGTTKANQLDAAKPGSVSATVGICLCNGTRIGDATAKRDSNDLTCE